jgi:hypothetical protein
MPGAASRSPDQAHQVPNLHVIPQTCQAALAAYIRHYISVSLSPVIQEPKAPGTHAWGSCSFFPSPVVPPLPLYDCICQYLCNHVALTSTSHALKGLSRGKKLLRLGRKCPVGIRERYPEDQGWQPHWRAPMRCSPSVPPVDPQAHRPSTAPWHYSCSNYV